MARDEREEREKIMHKCEFLKHDKIQANVLTMTKEIGAHTHSLFNQLIISTRYHDLTFNRLPIKLPPVIYLGKDTEVQTCVPHIGDVRSPLR